MYPICLLLVQILMALNLKVVALSEQKRECQQIADFPLEMGSTGVLHPDGAFVCSGSRPKSLWNNCYLYNLTGNQWDHKATMSKGRVYAASVLYNSTHIWVTGGTDGLGFSQSTEMLDITTMKFSNFVDLPAERFQHNLVQGKCNSPDSCGLCGCY